MISITGSSGFVGQNLKSFLKHKQIIVQSITRQVEEETFFFLLNKSIALVHLAGKAHDLKNTSSPDEYYEVNTNLTQKVFDAFLASDAKVFITLSSVKSVADEVQGELTEEHIANPITHYGKSKLMAEQYILSKDIPHGKRVYILRPCMIHGPGNKGNLNLLYNLVSKNIPWPLGAFENKRSFCSIDNLMFVIKELVEREDIPSGIYNIADDEAISTNELIGLIAHSKNRFPMVWVIPKSLIEFFSKVGDKLHFPFNSERLKKLTSSYIVSNSELTCYIGKPLPFSCREGLLKTFKSFSS